RRRPPKHHTSAPAPALKSRGRAASRALRKKRASEVAMWDRVSCPTSATAPTTGKVVKVKFSASSRPPPAEQRRPQDPKAQGPRALTPDRRARAALRAAARAASGPEEPRARCRRRPRFP